MAFRRKAALLKALEVDIAVISECECPDELSEALTLKPEQIAWHGANLHKGLGVVALNPAYSVALLHDRHEPAFRYVLPVQVTGPLEFTLFAVWAMDAPKEPSKKYVRQLLQAIYHYYDLFRGTVIVAGDFNGNIIWDNQAKGRTPFAEAVYLMQERGIRSVYHSYLGEEFGRETTATWYLYRDSNRRFHLDYIFASGDLMERLEYFEVLPACDWLKLSDHMPLFASFRVGDGDSEQE